MPEDLRQFIEEFTITEVENARTECSFRRPLIGFSAANDPMWAKLKEIADPDHMLPQDLLHGAKTVISFFIPFCEDIVRANRRSEGTAREWAKAYIETNGLINHIAMQLSLALDARGIGSAYVPATMMPAPDVKLTSNWSHKSAAAIAGLGSFGLHRMLITDVGCAGRCGSVVIDAFVEPTSYEQPERCLHFQGKECTVCVDACPVDALSVAGPGELNIDRKKCWDHLVEVGAALSAGLPEFAKCCGKCAVGPCATGNNK